MKPAKETNIFVNLECNKNLKNVKKCFSGAHKEYAVNLFKYKI